MKNAAILTIGTEITSGDVVNSNSSWLSSQLCELGIAVVQHTAVPDEHDLMLAAMKSLAGVDFLFVTGGLGPTSDDFTRDVISEWADAKLEYKETSWKRVHDLLTSRGIVVAESNKRQCYFPSGSKVLTNQYGTADGFSLKVNHTEVFVLPGPPRELKGIWSDHLQKYFSEFIPDQERIELRIWQCIGESESRLGEIVEEALSGSGLTIGYRARIPYVDIKIWCKKSEWDQKNSYIHKLEEAIGKFIVAKDREDVVTQLLTKFDPAKQIQIIDVATGGYLVWRIQQALATEEFEKLKPMVSFIGMSFPMLEPLDTALDLAKTCPADIAIVVTGIDRDGRWSLVVKRNEELKTETHRCRIKGHGVLERNQKMIAELTAYYAAKVL